MYFQVKIFGLWESDGKIFITQRDWQIPTFGKKTGSTKRKQDRQNITICRIHRMPLNSRYSCPCEHHRTNQDLPLHYHYAISLLLLFIIVFYFYLGNNNLRYQTVQIHTFCFICSKKETRSMYIHMQCRLGLTLWNQST